MNPCLTPEERPEEAEAKGEPLGGDVIDASPPYDEQTRSEIQWIQYNFLALNQLLEDCIYMDYKTETDSYI